MISTIGIKAQKPNPALKPLEPLVGEWQTTGSHPYMPGVVLHGRVSFAWIEGGAFLRMSTQLDDPNFPDGVAIFGSDDAAGTYYVIYFDERGVSRKYELAMSEKGLKWWRDDRKLSQRYTLTIGDNQLTGAGEMSEDGGAWGKDLSLTYERLT